MAKKVPGGNSNNKEGSGGYNVSPQEFCEIWESSNTSEEAAKRLKMPKAIASARASQYRAMGIPLKNMKRHYTKAIDVEGLKALTLKIKQGAAIMQEQEETERPGTVERPTLSDDGIHGVIEAAIADINKKKAAK